MPLVRWFGGKHLIYFMLCHFDFPNKPFPQLPLRAVGSTLRDGVKPEAKTRYSNAPIFQYSNWGVAPKLLLITLIIKGKENVIFLDTLYPEWHDKYFTSNGCPAEIWAANGEYFT